MNDERGYRKIVVVLLLLLMVGAAALIIFYPHQVQVTVEGEGAVDPMEGETSIIDGLTLEVMPDDGWVVGQVTVDGDRVDVTDNRVTVSPSPFDFSAIDVVVTFIPASGMSTLTVTSEGDGDVSPMGTTAQVHGSTVTVVASPDEGSVIDEVLVDGASVGSMNSIDVLMDADHSVHIVFREVAGSDIPITVTVDVDVDVVMTTIGSFYDWGDVEPHGTVYVEPGSSLTITVSLNPGFEVEDFTIDGVSDGSKLEHVLTDIQAPVEIGIFIFGYVNGYTVMASAGSGGSITPSGESIVAEGDDIKFTLSPRSSYAVSHILLDGERVNVSGRTYTLTDVRDNHTVQAVFKYVGGGGGSSDYRPVLKSIEVSGTFDRNYVEGQTFNKEGMIVTAKYSDGASKQVSNYTVSPSEPLSLSDSSITVTYIEGGVTVSDVESIKVEPKRAVELTASSNGEPFHVGDDVRRMITVSMGYNDGSTIDVDTNLCDYSPGYILTKSGDCEISITYGGLDCLLKINVNGSGSKSADVSIIEHMGVSKQVGLSDYDGLGSYIVKPGDIETFKLKISEDYGAGFVYGLRFHAMTGTDSDGASTVELADYLYVSVDDGNPVKLSSMDSNKPMRLGDSSGQKEFTITLTMPSSIGNEAMGLTLNFTMEVGIYETAAFQGGSA